MMKAKIEKELLNMGFNPIHVGTIYLEEMIYKVYCMNKSVSKINLESEIYQEVAKKYKKNPRTVKSNVVKATNAVDTEIFLSKHKMNSSRFKLTPKLVIWLVIRQLE